MNILVLQAYGKVEIFYEAAWCLASIWLHDPEFEQDTLVVIATDNPSFFSEYTPFLTKIEFITINELVLNDWKGPINFVHRVKIKVLQEVNIRYPNANLLYADTDTIFQAKVGSLFERIQNDLILMHASEGPLNIRGAAPLNKRIYSRFKNASLSVNNKQVNFLPDFVMFNAGVIGLPSALASIVLEETLILTDLIYPMLPKHIMEQLAFSYICQKHATVSDTSSEIDHYWNIKEARPAIKLRLEELKGKGCLNSATAFTEKLNELPLGKWSLERIKYRANPPLMRAFLRWTNKDWKLPLPLQDFKLD
jgi:hypothetical protein